MDDIVGQLVDKFVVHEIRAKEMEELRNRHQREKIMSVLREKVSSLQCTNNQLLL